MSTSLRGKATPLRTSASSNMSSSMLPKRSTAAQKVPSRLQPLPSDAPRKAPSTNAGSTTSTTTRSGSSTKPMTRVGSGNLKPIPGRTPSAQRPASTGPTGSNPPPASASTKTATASVGLAGSNTTAQNKEDSKALLSQTLPAGSVAKASIGLHQETTTPSKAPPVSGPRRVFTEDPPSSESESESDYDDESESDHEQSAPSAPGQRQQQSTGTRTSTSASSSTPAKAKPLDSSALSPSHHTPQKPAGGPGKTAVSPARTNMTVKSKVPTPKQSLPTKHPNPSAAVGINGMEWPPPTAEQKALLSGRKMEPRLSGEYACLFPNRGVFACLQCKSAVAGAASKIRAEGGYATFHTYCAANLETQLESKMQETRVLVFCKKCRSFMGELSYDGPTETGECLRVNSGCVRYCDVNYTGIDLTFTQYEEIHQPDGATSGNTVQTKKGGAVLSIPDDEDFDYLGVEDEDAAMFLDEEEIARKKAAAWGRSTASSQPPSGRM